MPMFKKWHQCWLVFNSCPKTRIHINILHKRLYQTLCSSSGSARHTHATCQPTNATNSSSVSWTNKHSGLKAKCHLSLSSKTHIHTGDCGEMKLTRTTQHWGAVERVNVSPNAHKMWQNSATSQRAERGFYVCHLLCNLKSLYLLIGRSSQDNLIHRIFAEMHKINRRKHF